MKKTLFIGSGNMACAIASGLIKSNLIPAQSILLFDKNVEQYAKFNSECIKMQNLQDAINSADIIFLSVKPQNIKEVVSLMPKNLGNKICVSICAGITMESIEKNFDYIKLVRAMPNTPLLIGQGVTALCKNKNVLDCEFNFIKSIFASSGITTEIEEKDINSLTAITSSSPAYVYLFIKAMLEGAKNLNFNYENTLDLICKTIIGSANMVLQGDKTIDEQIRMVKSPNGTTEKALNVLEEQNIIGIVSDAMKACEARAKELSELNK
ncbi:MAG: pyrroline-5-carboxylate reductase [Clostridia bacterium]|nr:pyrroline-5-carboxylate reductase [Clostridia bacterium]MBQ7788095.1 pyrroline-5-carboxylate reductase [Clostridia bacterium]